MQNTFFNKTYYIVSSNVQVRKNKVYNIESTQVLNVISKVGTLLLSNIA